MVKRREGEETSRRFRRRRRRRRKRKRVLQAPAEVRQCRCGDTADARHDVPQRVGIPPLLRADEAAPGLGKEPQGNETLERWGSERKRRAGVQLHRQSQAEPRELWEERARAGAATGEKDLTRKSWVGKATTHMLRCGGFSHIHLPKCSVATSQVLRRT
eukprot:764664-Hanusia_phi.AAC.1